MIIARIYLSGRSFQTTTKPGTYQRSIFSNCQKSNMASFSTLPAEIQEQIIIAAITEEKFRPLRSLRSFRHIPSAQRNVDVYLKRCNSHTALSLAKVNDQIYSMIHENLFKWQDEARELLRATWNVHYNLCEDKYLVRQTRAENGSEEDKKKYDDAKRLDVLFYDAERQMRENFEKASYCRQLIDESHKSLCKFNSESPLSMVQIVNAKRFVLQLVEGIKLGARSIS